MATFTPDKVSLDATTVTPAAPQDAKAHTGPVARLLAKVSKAERRVHRLPDGGRRLAEARHLGTHRRGGRPVHPGIESHASLMADGNYQGSKTTTKGGPDDRT